MSREWKPGDVAIVTDKWGRTGRGICNVKGGWDFTQEGESISFYSGSEEIVDARPLIVLDPDDEGDADRLADAWFAHAHIGSGPARMQVALRSLVADPKPDEPQGLGAVVEDAEGCRWVRCNGRWDREEGDKDAVFACHWDDVFAVRVLSEGWSA